MPNRRTGRWPGSLARAFCLAAIAACSGCWPWNDSGDHFAIVDTEPYTAAAARIQLASAEEPAGPAVLEPRRILRPQDTKVWPVTLAELQHIALSNVAVIRDRNQFLSPSNPVLSNPDAAPSAFDPAIQEFGGPYGGRGVEAALADFDTMFTTGILWGREEQLQNNRFLSGGLPPGATLTEESAIFSARFEKYLWNGAMVAVGHDWDYNLNNVPTRLFGSSYAGGVRAEFRQPLLAGAGREFNEIAGPFSRNLRGGTLGQGVVIARLNTRMSHSEFEARIQALLKQVEDMYWDLAFAHQAYESQVVARDTAKQVWDQVRGRLNAGLEGTGGSFARWGDGICRSTSGQRAGGQ